ncbi:MAG: hypothetical protein C0408_03610 [Odoribacter sp.]|nr:hypothetical protein [Odoribacter sp.]
MKAKIVPILVIFSLFSFVFSSCEDATYKEYKGNAPVYLSYEDLRMSVKPEQNVDLKNPGKIYFKDNYIFIIEELKGIHVFDNTNPSSPVKKTFIKIPGVVDIAVSGYIMYADSYVDLVILDLQNIDNIHEAGRMKDMLAYTVPPTGNDYPMGYIDSKKGVVIDWDLKTIREKVYNYPREYPIYFDKITFSSNSDGSSGVSGNGIGIGGSMARFGIKDKVLYLLGSQNLTIIDITSKTSPVKFNEIYPGWGIETMFLTDKNMFLGTTTGMVIYDISVPLAPASRVFFNHARSCDPVIVDDTLAYITLRSGTTCGGAINCLDVVNVKNLSLPRLVQSYPMTNPHGLGKSGDILFVCDGSAGLKIYDAADPKQISGNLIKAYPGINAYDVIPLGTVLVMIGDDGLYQYNYSNILNIILLSKISVVDK